MGKHIAVVGNLGAGKTTLTGMLSDALGATPYWEVPEGRPFQDLVAAEAGRWSLANQIDFLTYRAAQEREIRQATGVGIQDGGLDQDFQVFTRHLYRRGSLTEAEFALCSRTYGLLRRLMPPPDLFIVVHAPLAILAQRRSLRGRATDDSIISSAELVGFQALLDSWLGDVCTAQVIHVTPGDLHHDPAQVQVLAARLIQLI
jgi:deoxyadenosine/deoxycytidine kinase